MYDQITYNKVTQDTVETLRQIVGADNVLVEAEALEPFTHDETVGLSAAPEVVVHVTSTQQVSEIFEFAQEARIPVTASFIPPIRPASTRARSAGTSPKEQAVHALSSTA
jgi:FAD/FMN-containing dehydrogenase